MAVWCAHWNNIEFSENRGFLWDCDVTLPESVACPKKAGSSFFYPSALTVWSSLLKTLYINHHRQSQIWPREQHLQLLDPWRDVNQAVCLFFYFVCVCACVCMQGRRMKKRLTVSTNTVKALIQYLHSRSVSSSSAPHCPAISSSVGAGYSRSIKL